MKLTPRFLDALKLAFELDAGRPRKGTEVPYLAHLLGVCSTVLDEGGDEDQACAALLHDSLEDHGDRVSPQMLAERFGPRVRDLVLALSDTPEGFSGGPKPPWRERKEAYLGHLVKAGPGVLLISAADKLDNARAILTDYKKIGEALWPRFSGGREGQLWYYKELVQVYRLAGHAGPVSEDLERVVGELERAVKQANKTK